MKKKIGIIFLSLVMVLNIFLSVIPVNASSKVSETRTIAIVFDNSGSMYDSGDQAWCRATYAMEVFASMLNVGDTLMIYPMNPITADGTQYTMNKPLKITDASQAYKIREIYTKDAAGTPIESIECAADGLKKVSDKNKYMIILTDGGTFSKNGHGLSKDRTRSTLNTNINKHLKSNMSIMYLGIGSETCMPTITETDRFSKRETSSSEEVLSGLTEMCNQIFGRDILPKKYLSGNEIDTDISMSKMIVFVQGKDISELKMVSRSDKNQIKLSSTQQTKYSTAGSGDYKSVPDKSLQGMMVTYENCPAGKYQIEYQGNASSVEVYYEPNADLDFIFTDAEGNDVDLDKLYEGEYKISFGMKDALTGKLIESELLGNPHYEGAYEVNGKKVEFNKDGYSGDVPVTLKMGDKFKANLTAQYLSGYTISKDASDFGWPENGIKVGAPPLGKFKVELDIPDDYILLKEIDKSEEITAKLTVKGDPLTEREFSAVTMKVDCGGIDYTLTPNAADSSYTIKLNSTKGLEKGKYNIQVYADYKDIADRTAKSEDNEKITLSGIPLFVKWAIILGFLLLLAVLIYIILHIKRLPKYTRVTKKSSYFTYDDEEVTKNTQFNSQADKNSITINSKYGGSKIGFTMSVKPGKQSYLKTPQKSRYAEVDPNSVRKLGAGKIEELSIGSVRYEINEDTNKLERVPKSDKPFDIRNGTRISYSGTILDAGLEVPFTCITKLNFNKK